MGCGKREALVDAGIRTRTLHFGNGVEPQGLDPQTTTGYNDMMVQLAVFEPLLGSDPKTGAPEPGVAQSWEVTPDLLRYTFRLRPDARWSDGRPVVAHDFLRTAQRALSPALGSEAAEDFFWLVNAQAYFQRKETDFARVGIRVIDALTLEYTLRAPLPCFLDLLTGRMGIPLPMDLVMQHGGAERRGGTWTRPGVLVGNGPFVLKEWKPNKSIVVEKSATYWDRDRVKLERICFYPVENAETEEKMFRAGQLHKTFNLPVAKIATWQRERPEFLQLVPEQRNRILVVNPTRAPFSDPRVRRALALAIDRDQLARALGAGRPPARSFSPSDGMEFQAVPQYQDDAAQARALLAEAGFPGGKGFKRFELLGPNRGNAQLTMEMVQEMWRKNLGIEAAISTQEWGVYIDSENNGQYDVAYDGWNMSHPHLFYDLNRTGSPFSRYLWSSAEYDELLQAAARARTAEERVALYLQLEKILAREMPVIPLHFEVTTFLMHGAVRGWYPNWRNSHSWKYVSLDPGT